MIAEVHFRNFKALRSAAVGLERFNLFIGPNGSGKTSLIEALLRLRTLSGLPAVPLSEVELADELGPRIDFRFNQPFDRIRVTLGCNTDEFVCNLLAVDHPAGEENEKQWAELRARLHETKAYLFDHYAMAEPSLRAESHALKSNGSNIAAVLAARREKHPDALARLEADFCRILPEFEALGFSAVGQERVELHARLAGGGMLVTAENLSHGTLYLLALLTLAHAPRLPGILCIEEVDRGVHPRILRDVRDALYRLSYPEDAGEQRAPVQVIATTHSPYLLDLFKDHPEEIVLASKHGLAATFSRLSERNDLQDLLKEASLGDLWYSGILGGVPDER